MPLTPASFVAPAGLLRDAQFPGEDLPGELLPAWLADARARAAAAGLSADGQAVEAWVYYRAYNDRCNTLPSVATAAVASISVEGKGSMSFRDTATSKGPDYCALADQYLARAGVLLTVYDEVAAVPTVTYATVRSLR